MSPRVRAFVIVGALGFIVQLTALAGLTGAGVPLAVATAVAVEAAVLHNFVWHERWTWRDRSDRSGCGDSAAWRGRLLRFHTSNAIISLAVNVVLTWTFSRWLHLPPLAANTLAVGMASVANFAAADRWVFRRTATVALGATSAALVLGLLHAPVAAAAPGPRTLAAWQAYVRGVEARRLTAAPSCVEGQPPEGEANRVEDGTIYRWSGCTIVRNITVPALVDALIAAGTPPPQQDVLAAHLLERQGDRLRVFLKLERRAIVTVTYDTEHEMVFTRESEVAASSRSVATRIRQADGGDHGFLWQLQSYWHYRQQGPDVRVELVSLSLSRDVPVLLRAVAAPLIDGVARESMVRTLAALEQAFTGGVQAGARTTTPAASSALRTAAARAAAPVASP